MYRYKVVYTGYILMIIFFFSVYQCLLSFSALWLLFAGVSLYGSINTFVTQSNPRRIVVTDSTIAFQSFGERRFSVSELTRFHVRTSVAGYQVFIKAADCNGKTGRFWVNYSLFNDGQDLLKEFAYLERKVNPDSLRLQGRPELGKSRPLKAAEEKPDSPSPECAEGKAQG